MKWEKLTTQEDRKRGHNLCPICKGNLEQKVKDGQVIQERCVKGCYIYDFELGRRIK